MRKPFKVWKDVYMIGGAEVSNPYDCAVYLLDAGDLVLIDSGTGKSSDKIDVLPAPHFLDAEAGVYWIITKFLRCQHHVPFFIQLNLNKITGLHVGLYYDLLGESHLPTTG